MSALPAPAPAPPAPTPAQATPQLRTLLLTDLVDSTGTVERLGDGPSAELFRAHDRLVLELQQRWRGRLIDRSDGLLLMFERAIDGLGFALDYNRGLRELGKTHGVPLQARAGLHVGEVLTWRNSDEAVAVGAKPLEVEGLAKPLAGRLLGLARPGQILLSATAEALAHRAARELGERGTQLAWKSHGRWRFKGLPEPLEVYEAGEPGLAPLQTPRPDAKAWRDIPAWRRPAALAAELALVAVVAIGAWFFTRPQPAIAFAERDWVVVADMRNLTGQPVLDDSLQQAFRISLEQSRHVNVLSDLKARDTLARMQRQPGTALDREIASEIAVRDGARAVILPTVAEVGGRVRVSAEVIDPQSQTTVYAEYADGSGLDSVLASVDTVTAALRARLGEEIKAIERDSEPLPQVTTSNLDALRAYALGVQEFNKSNYRTARSFFERAVEMSPDFALAHVGVARTHNAEGRLIDGEAALRSASRLQQHLAPRERLYLQAWIARLDEPEREVSIWGEMARMYPDDFRAVMNVAYGLFREGRIAQGLPLAKAGAVSKNPAHGQAMRLLGDYLVAANEFAAADDAYRLAIRSGIDTATVRRASAFAAQRRFDDAAMAWKRARLQDGDGVLFDRVSLLLDQAAWSDAAIEADRLARFPKPGGQREREARVVIATAAWIGGKDEAAAIASENLARSGEAVKSAVSRSDALDNAYVGSLTALLLLRMDPSVNEDPLFVRAHRDAEAAGGIAKQLASVQGAAAASARGAPGEAIAVLEAMLDSGGAPYQARRVLLDAYIAAGKAEKALALSRWMRNHRGLAYVEQGCAWCQQPLNVIDSTLAALDTADMLSRLGRISDAKAELAAFDAQWPASRLPSGLRKRRDAVAARIVAGSA